MPRRHLSRCLLIVALVTSVSSVRPAGGARPADRGTGPAQTPGASGPLPRIRLEPAFPSLVFDRPVWMGYAPSEPDRVYVVEQPGRVLTFLDRTDTTLPHVFLDLKSRVAMNHDEEGLLALAFHPDHARNRRSFVYYSAASPRRTILSELVSRPGDPPRADPSSERELLVLAQPWGNHNGSSLLFGPDGSLYLSPGDGGSGGDPHRNAQNLGSLLGKILRLDVDRPSGGRPYGIPADNPFATGPSGTRPEIWAYGLRNVWRMSFDRGTGTLWAGDVGQGSYEEIDVIVRGGNYGWNVREGSHRHGDPWLDASEMARLIDPVLDYGRSEGACVTGGHVYRGRRIAGLVGAYVYADFVTGTLWGLRWDGSRVTHHSVLLRQPRNIASFAEDPAGELYVLCFDGRIYRLMG